MKDPRLSIILLVIFFAGIYSSCQRDRSTTNAPAALTDSLEKVIPPSFFRIPVSMSVDELEKFINEKIQGEFLETRVFPIQRDSHLVVRVKLSRFREIDIKTVGKELQIQIPLRAVATVEHSRVNLFTKDIKPVEAELLLTLQTPASLDRDWHLQTQLRSVDKKWVVKPVLKYTALKIDLSKAIENYLDLQGGKLYAKLDEEINKAVSLRKPISKIWNDIQKPILVVRKSPQAWIRFSCKSIAGEFHIADGHIVCETEIEAQVSMATDTNDLAVKPNLPSFRTIKITDPYSDVYVYGYVPFSTINFKVDSIFKGKSLKAAGIASDVKSIKVYPSKQGLCVDCQLEGDIDAGMVLCGFPIFDSVQQKFTMKEVDFYVNSGNAILQASENMLHDRIRDTIRSKLIFGLDTLIEKIPTIIETAIAKGKTGKKIETDIEEMSINSCEIRLGAKAIHVIAHTRFLASITILDIHSKRRLMIRAKESPMDHKKSRGKHRGEGSKP